MIKKSPQKIVIIFLISVVFHLSSQSQNRKYLVINGKIECEAVGSDNSSVQIVKNNQKAVLAQLPAHGQFRLELEYNAEYKLVFSNEGNKPKTIIVNTEIPENSLEGSSNFPHFLMSVKLVADNQNTGNRYSGNQTQHISYSPQSACFARVPAMLDVEYVEKGNTSAKIQAQENKAKMQEYQVF